MDEQRKQLQDWISQSGNIVFFGGAGVSTESGIPDFRSVDGLYNQQYQYPPETILSHTFFQKNPEEFYRFYRNKMLFPDAVPNAAHLKLAELEAGLPPDELEGRLAGLFPALDESQLTDLLTRLLFVAALYGYADARAED